MKYFTLFFIFLFISCSGIKEDNIIGVWKIASTSFESDDKKIVTELGKKMLTELNKDDIYNFKINNDVEVNHGHRITNDKWYLKKGTYLYIKWEFGTDKYKILKMTKDSMKLQELPLHNKTFIYELVKVK
ncbi:hypothetical protein ATE84_5212 [Aquimarina sp. MAR_2010_214]|uniref:hypothetical protein n=1 Tax=Aquimarina sp. MAR_2010_214 TaxID=1250026 RepID=UPI000C70B192|nr:hypothetical protein [Aquimarina sp. MAR_2010_214]PKV53077.1 hypothetical protein ATE84_5212 [Aquimarina sp. MAR_2010_214]